jgi:hypothetical protein
VQLQLRLAKTYRFTDVNFANPAVSSCILVHSAITHINLQDPILTSFCSRPDLEIIDILVIGGFIEKFNEWVESGTPIIIYFYYYSSSS